MPSLKERIENNLTIWMLGTLLTGFLAGIGVYKGILEIAQLEVVSHSQLKQIENSSKHLTQYQEQEKLLDSLKVRMEILDKKLIEYSQEKTPNSSLPNPINIPKKRGNVAGCVKDSNGKIVPFVKITRIANNAQTNSYNDGDFIIVSVYEGETLKFQKDGYKVLEYEVKPSDFKKLIEIIIKEG